jgi:hypothetical protein
MRYLLGTLYCHVAIEPVEGGTGNKTNERVQHESSGGAGVGRNADAGIGRSRRTLPFDRIDQ